MSSSRTILPKEVIEKVQSRYIERTGHYEFSYRGLCKDLILFVKEKEIPLRKHDLYENFMNGKNLKEKTIRDALTRDAHSNSGVTTKMKNLFCYYAYNGLLWKQTLDLLQLSEKQVEEESRRIKSPGIEKREDIFISKVNELKKDNDRIANMYESLSQDINMFKKAFGGRKYDEHVEKTFVEAMGKEEYEKGVEIIKNGMKEHENNLKKYKSLVVKNAFFISEILLRYSKKYKEAIKYADLALSNDANFIPARLIKAEALYEIKKYDESLKEVEEILEYEPHCSAFQLKTKLYYEIEHREAFDNKNQNTLGEKSPDAFVAVWTVWQYLSKNGKIIERDKLNAKYGI